MKAGVLKRFGSRRDGASPRDATPASSTLKPLRWFAAWRSSDYVPALGHASQRDAGLS
jgi:hypothetical protein